MVWQDEEAFKAADAKPWVQDFDRTQAARLLDEPYGLSRWQNLG